LDAFFPLLECVNRRNQWKFINPIRHYSGTRQIVRPEVFEKLANFQAYYSKEL
jgi:hypothetical protein